MNNKVQTIHPEQKYHARAGAGVPLKCGLFSPVGMGLGGDVCALSKQNGRNF